MKTIILLLMSIGISISLYAEDNYSLKCKIDNYKNFKKAYLYDYSYGNFNIIDTAAVRDGSFSFQFTKNNHPGIYKIRLSPDKVIENILFNYEEIELTADYAQLPESITYVRSNENIALNEYLQFVNFESTREKALAYLFSLYKNTELFYKDIAQELRRLKSVNKVLINNMAEKNKTLMASKYIRYEQFPEMLEGPGQKEYLIKNFWKNIDFSDSLLLHFPFYPGKIEDYLAIFENKKVERAEQEIIFREPVDFILNKASANKNVFDFTVNKLINDADVYGLYDLYSYIAEKYSTDDFCINDKRKKEIDSKLDKIQSLATGSIAPDIKITDELYLSKIVQDYTLVVFWESTCPKCYNILKDLIPVYDKFKGKKLEILAIALDKNENDYKKAILERGYNWINICDFKSWKSPMVNDYNVSSTPAMFLLDRNKKIISRPVSINHIINKIK